MASLFTPKTPTPTVTAPPPMPDNSSPQVLEAQKNEAAAASQRAGRLATILTTKTGPAANARNQDSYASSTLGGGGG